jgi:hypothetical protein
LRRSILSLQKYADKPWTLALSASQGVNPSNGEDSSVDESQSSGVQHDRNRKPPELLKRFLLSTVTGIADLNRK